MVTKYPKYSLAETEVCMFVNNLKLMRLNNHMMK